MRKRISVLGAGCLLLPGLSWNVLAISADPAPGQAGVNEAQLATRMPVHWVSVAQIENSLADCPPMAVGFDIDDTVLFSSPGFWYGKRTFSPGSDDYLHNPAFWEKMNNGWDAFSIPKEVARKLIAIHVRRGDSIWFITGRSRTPTETVSKTLQDIFHIPAAQMNPTIFAGADNSAKTRWIKDKHIAIYYGDADSDIRVAREAGARGIRVLRASNSTYKPLPQAGSLGEEVIVNSAY